jgi:hypothetical protein
LDIDGADTAPVCRLLIPVAENTSLTISGNILEGSVIFNIPALKPFIEKGTKKLDNVVMEAIIDDQYFVLNTFDIDLKEDISIKAEISETVKEEKVKTKPRFSVDTSDVEVVESPTPVSKMFN